MSGQLYASAPSPKWKQRVGSWVDPTASLDDLEKKNIWAYWDSNSGPSVVQLVASRYTDYATTASNFRQCTNNKYTNREAKWAMFLRIL
jgi:hypothetical protein